MCTLPQTNVEGHTTLTTQKRIYVKMTLIYWREHFSFQNLKLIVHLIRKFIVKEFKNKQNNGCLRSTQMGLFKQTAKFVNILVFKKVLERRKFWHSKFKISTFTFICCHIINLFFMTFCLLYNILFIKLRGADSRSSNEPSRKIDKPCGGCLLSCFHI